MGRELISQNQFLSVLTTPIRRGFFVSSWILSYNNEEKAYEKS